MAPERTLLLRAPWLVRGAGRVERDGCLLLRGGLVERVGSGASTARRLARAAGAVEDLEGVLVPGLVNAHSHLELYALAGRVSAEGGFAAWIGRLLALRAATSSRALRSGVARGAERMLERGTTTIGDIDSLGHSAQVLRDGPLRVVLYRELLDAGDPGRTRATWSALPRALAPSARYVEGFAPHAPFTVSPGLLQRVARSGGARATRLTVHWSETLPELLWMERGEGPLAGLLTHPPGRRGLDLLEDAGLLGPGLSLVHGNHPRRGEPARLARAGVTLVHCPGSHRFFGREPFPLRRYLRAGVPVGLGTDSAASNGDLDPWRELRLLREDHPWLAPGRAWHCATEGSARALGLADQVGRLDPGLRADLVHVDLGASGVRTLFERLTLEGPPVRGVWVEGLRSFPRPA